MRFFLNYKRGIFLLLLLLTIISGTTLTKNTIHKYINDNNTLLISAPDDPYYPNNSSSTAFDLSSYENTWLSLINGTGIQLEPDWFNVTIMPGKERLIVKVLFWHFDDNLDIFVLDGALNPVVNGTTSTDNEYIDHVLPSPGIYYLVVYGNNVGNKYDLLWSSLDPLVIDDVYDFNDYNDILNNATDISFLNNTWLSSFNGLGIKADDDWYEIFIPSGYEHLKIELIFCHAFGDIDIEIWDSMGPIPGASSTDTIDNEFIDFILPYGGVFYIHLYYDNAGNTYDLRWTSLTPSDDSYEENDDYWSSKWVDPNYYSNLRIVDGDEDWFHIYLNPGDIIDVNIYFSNLEGNLQLELYSPFDSITFKAGSHSDTNDYEFVSYTADTSGDWKIRVYHKYGNSSAFYDLDILVNVGDDWMEENDDFWSARWVDPNYYGGLMIVGNDEDWFRLHLDHGDTINVVIKNFDHNIGNLQLELFHPDNYHVIGSYMSNPTYHEEFISFTVQYPGEWRIRVYQVSGVSDVSYDMDIWLDKIDPTKEDPYEWNDFPNEAFPLQKHEHTWLSNFHGNAKQGTEDWYVIFITPGFQQLFIYVKFNHTEGNIDISVYEVYGWDQHNVNYGFIEGNYSLDNNEQFYYFLNPGYYLIQIHGEFRGNEYDLWWDDLRTDFRSEDNYEDNDDPSSAYDLSYEIAHRDDYGIVGKSLGHISNIGIQYDNDWYKINVGREFLQLRVSILYEYSAGALGIELYDWDLTKLTGNFTMRDDEYLNYILPSNGTYYIRIYGDCSGSPYDLRWELREYYKKMIPGYDTLILLSVIFGVITVITVKQKRSKKNF